MSLYQEDAFAAKLASDICSVIDDLKANNGLQITVHLLNARLSPCWYRFLPYNLHQNIYCLCIKDSSDAWQHCIDCQERVLSRARERGSYTGICWAGCLEAIFALSGSDGMTEAFLSVSGYGAPMKDALPRLYRASRRYDLGSERLLEAYGALKREPPDMAYLTRLLMPLRYMIMLLIDHYSMLAPPRTGDECASKQYQHIMAYINRYFAQKITIQSLAETFHCSYSSISHIFKRFSPCGFTQTLAQIRVDAAKKHLEYTSESILEIASCVGFDDPNYFSYVFRRETGMSPTQWRQIRACEDVNENDIETFG